MVERPKGWEIYDLITGKQWWWPFKAQCPKCQVKNVECKRGHLGEHRMKSGLNAYCNNNSFVGHEVKQVV